MFFISLWTFWSSLLMHMRLFTPWATAANCTSSLLFLCFLKCLFLFFCRLLADMIPRIRQTRNYERFEWRPTDEKRGRRGMEGLGGMERGRLTDWQERDGDFGVPQTLYRQSHSVLEVPTVQSSQSKIWIEDPGSWWRCRQIKPLAPFKCFKMWCKYIILICLLTVNGAVCSFMPPHLRSSRQKEMSSQDRDAVGLLCPRHVWTLRVHKSNSKLMYNTSVTAHRSVNTQQFIFPWFLEAFAQLCYKMFQCGRSNWLM